MAIPRATLPSAGLPPPPSPGARRLASALSVATRIEPELVRSMRLAVFPGLDVGAEADLWFSDWVGLRNPGGIVFLPRVLPFLRAGLREMLNDNPAPASLAERIWEVISQAHQNLSPALFLEERVTWLAVTGGDATEVEQELRQALVALADEGRTGIAGWMADARLRLPPEVLETTTAWQLSTVAAGHAGFGPPSAPASVGVPDIAAVAHALGDVPLPLLREGPALLFGELNGPGVAAILVPDTDPVIVDVESSASRRQTVQVPRGEVVRVELADTGPVTVRTARGSQYVVTDQPAAQAPPDARARDRAAAPLGWDPALAAPDPDALHAIITQLTSQPTLSADELRQLGRARLDLFLLGGDAAELDGAIAAYRSAVTAAAVLSAALLAELADALYNRFLVSGSSSDLAEAKGLARRAVDATRLSEPNALLILTAIQLSEFQTTGDVTELDEAVGLVRETAGAIPGDDQAYPLLLTRAAELLIARFGASGAAEDLDQAAELIAAAVRVTPAAHPQLGPMLSNLANSLLLAYRLRGDPQDLRQSIDLFRRSAATSPSAQRPTVLAALSTALRTSFELSGDLSALDEAVATARAGAAALPGPHDSRPAALEALGNALQTRFSVTGRLEDLDEAVTVLRAATDAIPASSPGRPSALANLAGMLLARFSRTGEPGDLGEAMTVARQAVADCPPRSPYRTACLTVLADALYARHVLSQDAFLLQEAGTRIREAIGGLPDGSPARPALLIRLAEMLLTASQRYDPASSLDEGIAVAEDAVAAAAEGTPTHARALSTLATLFRERHSRDERSSLKLTPSAADTAIESWLAAARTESAPISVRLDAAVSSAELAVSLGRWPTALPGYRIAVDLLPLTTWRGTPAAERASILGRYARLGQDAAACALRADQPELALEMLEQCRGLFWEQALARRTDLVRLREAAPELAARLDAVRARLDAAEQRPLIPELTGRPLAEAADERYALAREWDELLHSVRAIAGFESFLRPLPFSALLNAARGGPVIVINVSLIGCDALVIGSRGLSIMSLPVSFAEVEAAAASYSRLGRNGQMDDATTEEMTRILAWLWSAMVGPVLDALDLPPVREGEPYPRVWWCPTGPLTALPLHAAEPRSPGRTTGGNAMDRVCSSYTPTLRALIEARAAQVGQQDAGHELLIVENPSTRREMYLEFGREEVAAIQALAERVAIPTGPVLQGGEATSSAVLARLSGASVLHFVGHATQQSDPAEGGLYLADETLTLARISALRFPGGSLAYLSACDTALTDDHIPDVVTLAAAFHVCGFRNVIAVLSVVGDREAARVGIGVYERLILPHGYLRPENSALALHGALRNIRRHEAPTFPWYAAFIHIGP